MRVLNKEEAKIFKAGYKQGYKKAQEEIFEKLKKLKKKLESGYYIITIDELERLEEQLKQKHLGGRR